MGADRYTEPAVLARYIICQLSYIGYSVQAGILCQLLTAYATPASAASDQASWEVVENKARHDIASRIVCPSTQRQDQLFLNHSWKMTILVGPKTKQWQ